jgi:xylulose-5-phosphate/fructose-6-phosphate phosphoketolase
MLVNSRPQEIASDLSDVNSTSAYGRARATITGQPLDSEELRKIDAYWRACCYLAVGMIYLSDNPLLRVPLQPEHIKNRLLGHWGSSPGLAFMYIHINRLIKKLDLNAIFIAGPGHGAPGVLGPVYLEGTYSEVYTDKSQDEAGLKKFFQHFSFPGGIGSHCTSELPGSIHEGGELGYALSHACGAIFDNPDLISIAVVGDGEAETGPMATAWHSSKFINPIRDGAVLPILHLNGYKIDNPTVLSRVTHEELEHLFRGYGYTPYFIEGDDPQSMHQSMAATLDHCVQEIRNIQQIARSCGVAERPYWPMIILRSPKGWTCPKEVDGHKVEGFWRSHQIPIGQIKENPEHLHILENWMLSYKPQELFDESGKLIPELQALAPTGMRRMSANPHANGGLLRQKLELPDFRNYGIEIPHPGQIEAGNTYPLGVFLRDIVYNNPNNFRVFSPDENTSNKLTAIYAASKKFWIAKFLPEDLDGGELANDGRVMEILSEHTLEGWLEGYLLSGRHGFFSTYEAFIHIIDSMVNQHCKWLETCNRISWRASISSLNFLITSTVWRQEHNGFTHQDPGFLDILMNKDPKVTRIYLPPDINCLLSVADHCLQSSDNVNAIVADKQMHLQYLDREAAVVHCTKGLGIWEWASTDRCEVPDLVMACAGDVPTLESLAATAILRENFPDLKVRFINVVNLFKLQPNTEHPHGLNTKDFDSLFTTDRPIIFNFHGYPWLIHRLTYRRTNHDNLHVRGYKEKGNINTQLELAILNEIDRYSLAIDAIDRVPKLQAIGAHLREHLKNMQIDCLNHARTYGIDKPEAANWKWPF